MLMRHRSWEVWRSDWGNVETRNDQESALEGAVVSFSVESGDGSVSTTRGHRGTSWYSSAHSRM